MAATCWSQKYRSRHRPPSSCHACDFPEPFPQGFSKPFPHPEPGGQAGPWLPPTEEVVMAYRELGVIEIREVLRRFCLGEGLRAIARGTRSDRKTVAKY